MSHSRTISAPVTSTFVCKCAAFHRSVCEGLKEYEGTGYCVLHYANKEKVAAFKKALDAKLKAGSCDFRGVYFPDKVSFSNRRFNERVSFDSATFSAEAHFNFAEFNKGASFCAAVFGDRAYFRFAQFGTTADFQYAKFKWVTLLGAIFKAEANFNYADFGGKTSLGRANFGDHVSFQRSVFGGADFTFHFARVENPERFSFHTLKLTPSWFVNLDARKFEFINVDWDWRDTRQEIKSLEDKKLSPAPRLLAIAYRNLAVNAEENHRYEEASRFRRMAMEAQRLEKGRGFAPLTLSWWYWLASGYGERVWQAFAVLVGIWVLFFLFYMQVGFVRWEPRVASEQEAAAARDEVGEPLRWQRALTYSLGVMTLQKPEPRPATNWAQGLVMLETILGPVQAALLALAIRRKFMR